MKRMKKVFALAMTLAMTLAMAVPTMAADPENYTVTIENSDPASSAGHKYEAYQIFDGTLDSSGTILTQIEWGENMPDDPTDPDDAASKFMAALQAHPDLVVDGKNIFADADTAAEVAAVLAVKKHDTAAIRSAFAECATASKSGNPVASSTEDDQPYTIVIPAEKAGYYLIHDVASELEGEADKDVSDYILQVVGDVKVEHKGSIPTMDKSVSETGATYHDYIHSGINETHYYRIVAELPDDYRLYDEYYLEFSDKMSEGLTFDEIVVVKALIRSSGAEVVIDEDCYEVAVADITGGGTHLTVVIDDTKTITADDAIADSTTGNAIVLSSADAIEVIYTAHLNSSAVADGNGIPNVATIIYSNDPNTNGKGESSPDETNVYPVNLKIVKVDGKDTTTELAGAEFVLARSHSTGTETHHEYAVVDSNGKISQWVHHYAADDCAAGAHDDLDEALGSVLTTDADGAIRVEGLDPGRYDLIEIKAPDGYNPLAENVEIAVSITVNENTDKISSMTGNTNQGDIRFNADTATVTVTITNFKGDVLPSTGGMGTTVFYLVGGLMAATAVVLLVTKKRMNDEA